MSRHHWIDDFSKTQAGRMPRRGFFGGVSALAIGLMLDGMGRAAIAKKGGKGGKSGGGGGKNGKKKGKGQKPHKPKPPKQPPAGDACDTTWPGDDETAVDNRNHCRYIRAQCKVAGTQFCIRLGEKPDGTLTKVADCCEEDEKCCGSECCPKEAECCGGYCCFAPGDDPEWKCCDDSCVHTGSSNRHCGLCFNACEADETCIERTCLPKPDTCALGTRTDGEDDNSPSPCGPGGASCPLGEACCDGRCYDPSVYVCCPDGSACPASTHDCNLLPNPHPDGRPAYGCIGKG